MSDDNTVKLESCSVCGKLFPPTPDVPPRGGRIPEEVLRSWQQRVTHAQMHQNEALVQLARLDPPEGDGQP